MKYHFWLNYLIAAFLALTQASLTFTGVSAYEGPPYPDPDWELVFIKSVPEGNSIAISDIKGENIRLIGKTYHFSTVISLQAISPDGRQIAYRLDGAGMFDDHIQLINSDGSNDHTFLNGKNPSFSPDGKKMVLELGGGLFIADIAARKSVPLRVLPGVEKTMPAWSPDGEHIAFIGYEKEKDNEDGDLYIAGANAAFVQQVKTGIKMDQYSRISWSPDGGQLAFASKDGYIFLYNTASRETIKLNNLPAGSNTNPAWSPDGDWLMYHGAPPEGIAFRKEYKAPLWLMAHLTDSRIDGVDDSQLSSLNALVFINPAIHVKQGSDYQVTSAGDYLNLRKKPSTSAEVITMLRAGETVTPLDGPREADGYKWWPVTVRSTGLTGWLVDEPGWLRPFSQNADSKPIPPWPQASIAYFYSKDISTKEIRYISRDKSQTGVLTKLLAKGDSARLSPDGSTLVYSKMIEPGKGQLMLQDISKPDQPGREIPVKGCNPVASTPSWGWDSSEIAVTCHDNRILIVSGLPDEISVSRTITAATEDLKIDTVAWLPGGRYIAYEQYDPTSGRDSSSHGPYIIDLENCPEVGQCAVKAEVEGVFTWTPDGLLAVADERYSTQTTLAFVDPTNGKVLRSTTLPGTWARATSLAWSVNSDWLAFSAPSPDQASHDGVFVINLANGEKPVLLDGQTGGHVLFWTNAGADSPTPESACPSPTKAAAPKPWPTQNVVWSMSDTRTFPEGQYMVYSDYADPPYTFKAFSPGGMFRTFGTATIMDQPVFSVNSRFAYAGNRLFSRSGRQWSEVPLPDSYQCIIQAISADGNTVVTGMCPVPPKEIANPSLSIWTKDSVVHLDKMDGFDVDLESALSPDGSKLAFCLNSAMSTRAYTLDVPQCLADPASCGTNRQGPFFGCPRYMAWSPDNTKIVHDDLPDIKVFDLATGTDTVIDHDENLEIIHSITWSPDGKFIAYSADDSRSFGQDVIKVYSFNTGQVNTMVTSDQLLLVYGWLTVPEE